MKVTLGGDRLGSGNKNNLHLHNYYRSTHNLSQGWTSPMTVGALYPFLVLPAMRNDKFEIKLDADAITIPTVGPLFGSFKMQVDVFFCPIRLYQAILHNNPTNIGLKMNQVLLPTYMLEDNYTTGEMPHALNKSCLWKYLGLSGIGSGVQGQTPQKRYAKRYINAVPLLAYYDIFKNYYSNKQEEDAYVIGSLGETISAVSDLEITDSNEETISAFFIRNETINSGTKTISPESYNEFLIANNFNNQTLIPDGGIKIEVTQAGLGYSDTVELSWKDLYIGNNPSALPFYINLSVTERNTDTGEFTLKLENRDEEKTLYYELIVAVEGDISKQTNLQLNSFKLKNIDDMRMAILSHHTLGSAFAVNEQDYLPYNINTHLNSRNPLNGLVVKTYQSDIFNNWVNTEWIDGENGIAEITKIATTDGAFKIDQLNLAEKLYNMLNRVAVSGGTYEDWQDAVYDQAPHKHIESPIYLGGMSSEIVFEQIVQTAPAEGDPLGTLAGRGRHIKRKGGHIICKCDEAGFVIGIVSLTPRIKYCQGNEFYLTELKSLDDLHKPALDGIGFQNLLGERLAWWDTRLSGTGEVTGRSIVGKVPAWLEYMTAVDKTYGDFADIGYDPTTKQNIGKSYMVLNRAYEPDMESEAYPLIKDVTTYIDPTKYNYAFAYSAIDAQNFWVEIYSHITARRKMSAKQIPNL